MSTRRRPLKKLTARPVARKDAYNPLLDPNLRHFFTSTTVQSNLLRTGLIDESGRIVNPDRHGSASHVHTLEAATKRSEAEELELLRREEELRRHVQHAKLRQLEEERRVKLVAMMREQARIREELQHIARGLTADGIDTGSVMGPASRGSPGARAHGRGVAAGADELASIYEEPHTAAYPHEYGAAPPRAASGAAVRSPSGHGHTASRSTLPDLAVGAPGAPAAGGSPHGMSASMSGTSLPPLSPSAAAAGGRAPSSMSSSSRGMGATSRASRDIPEDPTDRVSRHVLAARMAELGQVARAPSTPDLHITEGRSSAMSSGASSESPVVRSAAAGHQHESMLSLPPVPGRSSAMEYLDTWNALNTEPGAAAAPVATAPAASAPVPSGSQRSLPVKHAGSPVRDITSEGGIVYVEQAAGDPPRAESKAEREYENDAFDE